MHPVFIWRDAAEELARPDFWSQYDIAKIVGDCTMLDVRNAAFGMRQRLTQSASSTPSAPAPVLCETQAQSPQQEPSQSPFAVTSPPPLGKHQISLQDMIATSVALKSGLDIEIMQPSAEWSSYLFPTAPSTRSQSRDDDESALEAGREGDIASLRPSLERLRGEGEHDVPSHVAQAIAALQREVLLLRNELNFELWMTRENVKHIGRLYQDRVLSRTAESERQGLVSCLNSYRGTSDIDINQTAQQVTGIQDRSQSNAERAKGAQRTGIKN